MARNVHKVIDISDCTSTLDDSQTRTPTTGPTDVVLVRRVTNNQTAAPGLACVTYKNTMQLKYGIPWASIISQYYIYSYNTIITITAFPRHPGMSFLQRSASMWWRSPSTIVFHGDQKWLPVSKQQTCVSNIHHDGPVWVFSIVALLCGVGHRAPSFFNASGSDFEYFRF